MEDLLLDLELPPLEEPARRLSYTALSTYETCGLQYRFRYVDRLASKPSPILSFGQALHEALRAWYNQPVPVAPPLGDLLAALDAAWERPAFPSPAAERTYKNHARQVLGDFHARNAGSFRLPVALEQRFSIDVEGVTVSGVIDRMDRHPDGSYEIIDYKTNRRLPPLARVEKDLQLSIYALAAWEVWGIRPERLTLYFLLPGQAMTTTRTPEDLAATRDRIASVADRIAAGRFEPRESALCGWCDYRAQCPLFAHAERRAADPEPDIQAVVDEWIARTKRTRVDYARLEELEQVIHDYCERHGLERLFGDDGAVTRFERTGATFDPRAVVAALPPELLRRVLRIDDDAVGALLAGDVPEPVRVRLEEARVAQAIKGLRLREDRRRR